MPSPSLSPRRPGFTLFEVAIALLLVSLGVVSMLAVFPAGLRQLEMQRFRIYAACIANQLVDVYAHGDANSVFCDQEAPGPWDLPVDRRVNAPDLELRCSNQRFGLMPLPTAIARRLDTDGEEIQRLLDAGGQVYYVQPNVPNAWREDLLPTEPPNNLQKMLVGVVGSAQHNASNAFPMKRWPYYGTVPGPPLHAIHNRSLGWDRSRPEANGTPFQELVRFEDDKPKAWRENRVTYCWQACVDTDPALRKAFAAFWDYLFQRGHTPEKLDEPFKTALGGYIQATVTYCKAAQVTVEDLNQFLDAPPPIRYPFTQLKPEEAARKVLALNYLSHALMCLTRWHKLDVEVTAPVGQLPALNQGVDLERVYGITLDLKLAAITHDRIVNLVRNTRACYYRFAAQHPYNWAVPRPIEHATMMDYPLMELDLFREPAVGSIWGLDGQSGNGERPGGKAHQWQYLFPTPVGTVTGDAAAPLGVSLTYPLGRIPSEPRSPSSFVAENGPASGSISHSTILNRFEASERCRQIVFWVADWQSYADCETAPSAPVDASRYPKAAPGGVKPANPGSDGRGWDTAVSPCTTFDDLMWGFTDGWGDATGLEQTSKEGPLRLHRALVGAYVHAYRNPEKNLLFNQPVADWATGSDVSACKVQDQSRNDQVRTWQGRSTLNIPPDYGPPTAGAMNGAKAPEVFSGRFGADRNGNNRLDRGGLASSVRLRAVTVARFNYYDLRVPCQFR